MNLDTFIWQDQHDVAFAQLKDSLADAVELTFPHKDADFSITTDASSVAIGGCLHQIVNGQSSPLSHFFSRKLSETEARYSTFDRELLAIFAAVKKWRDIIQLCSAHCGGSLVTLTTVCLYICN